MSNIETQAASWWSKFHAWTLKNPGFYIGVLVGVVGGALLRGLF